MKKTIFIVLLLSCLGIGMAQSKKRVLFLGNSYTAVNNLPQLVTDVAQSTNDTVLAGSNTPGGYTLQGHSTNTTSLNAIMLGTWDVVVLQEQSQLPSFPISQVQTSVFPYARALDSTIKVYNPCAETMFYRTWGRKNGDASNCVSWPPVCTYQGMDSLLHLRYQMMADSNKALLSPVGAVWRYLRKNASGIELYQPDESHPSEAGSYAAACCFYTAIFRKNPINITYDYTLSASDAATIRNAAKLVVYDSLLTWNIGKYDLTSSYTFVPTSGYTVSFTNTSISQTGQLWDFGSGTSTSANPLFTFPGAGIYPVKLTTFNACGDTVVSTQNVNVSLTHFTNPVLKEETLCVYPNPSQNELFWRGLPLEPYTVQVYDRVGKKVLELVSTTESKINIQSLTPGMYQIVFKTNTQIHSRKFVVGL